MKELLNLRLRLKWTQEQMAKYLEVSFSYYSKIESGVKTPSYNFLIKVKEKFPELDMNIFLCAHNTKSVID